MNAKCKQQHSLSAGALLLASKPSIQVDNFFLRFYWQAQALVYCITTTLTEQGTRSKRLWTPLTRRIWLWEPHLHAVYDCEDPLTCCIWLWGPNLHAVYDCEDPTYMLYMTVRTHLRAVNDKFPLCLGMFQSPLPSQAAAVLSLGSSQWLHKNKVSNKQTNCEAKWYCIDFRLVPVKPGQA